MLTAFTHGCISSPQFVRACWLISSVAVTLKPKGRIPITLPGQKIKIRKSLYFYSDPRKIYVDVCTAITSSLPGFCLYLSSNRNEVMLTAVDIFIKICEMDA